MAEGLKSSRWYHPSAETAPRRGAARRPGVALEQARRTKEATYPELAGDEGRARLVVLAAETGGRWSGGTAEFLRCLAKAKAGTAPVLVQNKVKTAWLRKWCCPF